MARKRAPPGGEQLASRKESEQNGLEGVVESALGNLFNSLGLVVMRAVRNRIREMPEQEVARGRSRRRCADL